MKKIIALSAVLTLTGCDVVADYKETKDKRMSAFTSVQLTAEDFTFEKQKEHEQYLISLGPNDPSNSPIECVSLANTYYVIARTVSEYIHHYRNLDQDIILEMISSINYRLKENAAYVRSDVKPAQAYTAVLVHLITSDKTVVRGLLSRDVGFYARDIRDSIARECGPYFEWEIDDSGMMYIDEPKFQW